MHLRFRNRDSRTPEKRQITERKSLKTFKELDLIEPLERALAEEHYETPTPIQAKTIPHALKRCDILGCAQTGTGKTAAFALPILNRLGQQNRKAKPKRPFALILAPTRELAVQIGDSFEVYGRHLQLRVALIYGGVNQKRQEQMMSRGSHILVATPGRLLDLMNQGFVKLDELEVFVLDEADRMLDMGFMPDLKRIIRELPDERQSLFFSATLPPKIVELTEKLLVDPVNVNVTPKSRSLDKIDQRIAMVGKKGKQDLLEKILTDGTVERAIVFTKTKRMANQVSTRLDRNGISATAIHGNKSQNARQRSLDAFKNDEIAVLVATDVAARGIDIDGVSHVVNYDLPLEPEAYVHRIGRTGRAGAAGIAISFVTNSERAELNAIQKLIGIKIPIDKSISQGGLQDDDGDRSHEPRVERSRSSRRNDSRPQRGSTEPRSRDRNSSRGRSDDSKVSATPSNRSRSNSKPNAKPSQAVSSNASQGKKSVLGEFDELLAEPQSAGQPRRSGQSKNGTKQSSIGGKKPFGNDRRPKQASEGRSSRAASSQNDASGRGRTKVTKANRSSVETEPFVFGVTQSKPKKKKKQRPGKKERLQAKESNPA